MIHWTTEGSAYKKGLNFSWTKTYIRFIFVTMKLPLEITSFYFRFRFKNNPKFFYYKDVKKEIDVINNYIFERDLYLKTREEVEDGM